MYAGDPHHLLRSVLRNRPLQLSDLADGTCFPAARSPFCVSRGAAEERAEPLVHRHRCGTSDSGSDLLNEHTLRLCVH